MVNFSFDKAPKVQDGSPLYLNIVGYFNSMLTIDKDGMVTTFYGENDPGTISGS